MHQCQGFVKGLLLTFLSVTSTDLHPVGVLEAPPNIPLQTLTNQRFVIGLYQMSGVFVSAS